MPEESSYQRGDKFVRVIRVFDILQRSRIGRTSQELADELEVDVRSVQRYLRQIQDAGIDIVCDDRNRYRLGDETRLPALQFTKPEGVAVLIALRLLQQMRRERDDALLGAVGRLAAAMQMPSVTSYLGTMVRGFEEQPPGSARGHIEAVVVQCFADRLSCEIEYENAKGETSKRVVEVYFLEPRPESRTVYLYARDRSVTGMRWFRMDRIRAARPVKVLGTYNVPEDFDIDAVIRSSWGVWQVGDELEEVILRFRPSIAPRVRLSTWHSSAELVDLPGGGVEMRLRVASEIEMRPWVLGWGSQVEVIAPPSLREHVAVSMREGEQMYDTHPSPE